MSIDSVSDDLVLFFETDEDEVNQLVPYTREVITEEEIRKTYLSGRFETVQYGSYRGRRACLLIMTFTFHSSDPKSHRFRRAKIDIEFSPFNANTTNGKGKSKKPSPEILSLAPERAYGIISTSKETKTQGLSGSLTIGNSLVSGSLSPSLTHVSEYVVGHRSVIESSLRGVSRQRVVWTVIENEHHPDGVLGIPSRLRTAVLVGLPDDELKFSARFEVEASVGWSLDPRRLALWPLIARKDDPVLFDYNLPLRRDYEVLGPVFDGVDVEKLCRISLSPEQGS